MARQAASRINRKETILYIVVPVIVAIIGAGFYPLKYVRGFFDSPSCSELVDSLVVEQAWIEVGHTMDAFIHVDNPDGELVQYSWRAVFGKMTPGLRTASSQSNYKAPSIPSGDTILVDIFIPDCKVIKRSVQISIFSSLPGTPTPREPDLASPVAS